MKNFLKLSALTLAIISFTSNASAVNNITGNTVTATVYTPIAITKTSDLAFGTFSSAGTSGTITQAGTTTGGVTAVTSTRTAAVYNVTGNISTGYTITSVPATVSLTGPGTAMTATLTVVGGMTGRTLNGSGADTITINGSLAVGANQAAGNYSGTYDITVNY